MSLKLKHNQAVAIVEQLTLEEKARLCSGKNFWYLEALERFDVPPVMITDGPHGLRKQDRSADHLGLNQSVPATCFPTACALASSWDTALLEEVGVALGREAAAENVAVLLGPGMNIKRHPLCGRNFEYFSEDPLLTGKLAAAMVKGVQSQGVGTSIKHFAVNNQEAGRMIIDAIVDERTLREIYLRGFEIAVRDAQPWTVMCAYNRVNGTYCSEHDWLLNQVLRSQWGFEGLVVTDWGATNDRVAGLASGLDLEMPGSGGINDLQVLRAVRHGELSTNSLDQSIRRNVALSLLGADLSERQHTVDHTAHHEFAMKVAIASTVLLKNENALLPLSGGEQIAVIGEFAKRPRYQGTGSSQVNPTRIDCAYDAIAEITGADFAYARGYDATTSELDQALIDEAAKVAGDAHVALVFAGLPTAFESEGFDRSSMRLPAQHEALIAAVCDANPNCVVILANGAAVEMPWVPQPGAIIESYLAGQAGGSAIAQIIFGLANPSGKLAETFPVTQGDLPADANFPGEARQVHYREGLNVGYRYFDTTNVPVLFPFGHGLSYTQFEYGDLNVEQHGTHAYRVSLTVSNTGSRAGQEVVQLYIHPPTSRVFRPDQELKDFAKLHLAPGETGTVAFNLTQDAFSYWDRGHGDWNIEGGMFEVRVGASSNDIRSACSIEIAGISPPSATEAGAHVKPSLPFSVDDDEFENMLQHAIPAPEPVRPYNLNSSLNEVGQSWLGARFKARVTAGFLASIGGSSTDTTLNKMFAEMANNMPLRALSLFSRGKVTIEQLNLTIALLNHQYWRALKLWFAQK
jgi:beta-glucosidase